jgi:hypothetical protein
VPVYIAVVDGAGTVEYEAEVFDLQLDPEFGDAKTEALFKHVPPEMKHEGLLAPGLKRPARTLYAIRRFRRVPRPFPITTR